MTTPKTSNPPKKWLRLSSDLDGARWVMEDGYDDPEEYPKYSWTLHKRRGEWTASFSIQGKAYSIFVRGLVKPTWRKALNNLDRTMSQLKLEIP